MKVREEINAFSTYIEDTTGRVVSGDYSLPPRLVYHYLLIARSKVLFDKSKRFRSFGVVDNSLVQTIPCVELKNTDKVSDCPCALDSGCTWLKASIPKPLDGNLISVVTLDGSTYFDYVPWQNFEDSVINSRYETNIPVYTTRVVGSDFFLYVYTNSKKTYSGLLNSISVSLIAENPLDVIDYKYCGGSISCSPLDEEFVIDQTVRFDMYNVAVTLLRAFLSSNPGMFDIENNENNDSKSKFKKSPLDPT